MRISDWSSDVCSSDLLDVEAVGAEVHRHRLPRLDHAQRAGCARGGLGFGDSGFAGVLADVRLCRVGVALRGHVGRVGGRGGCGGSGSDHVVSGLRGVVARRRGRSEENTPKLQSRKRSDYTALSVKNKTKRTVNETT